MTTAIFCVLDAPVTWEIIVESIANILIPLTYQTFFFLIFFFFCLNIYLASCDFCWNVRVLKRTRRYLLFYITDDMCMCNVLHNLLCYEVKEMRHVALSLQESQSRTRCRTVSECNLPSYFVNRESLIGWMVNLRFRIIFLCLECFGCYHFLIF